MTVSIIFLVAEFLAGAHRGYNLGYLDGKNRANGWWIDKKPTIMIIPKSGKSESTSNTIIFEHVFDSRQP